MFGERRKTGMKKIFNLRTLFTIICVCLLAVSIFQIGMRLNDYRSSRSVYSEVADISGITDASDADTPSISLITDHTPGGAAADTENNMDPLIEDALSYFKDCDFDALLAINDEIIGWIVIPGTNISYPICQHYDNQYYLKHTVRREPSIAGAIFADHRVKEPFKEFNTILYGHRMLNQTMFATLKIYVEKEEWEKHPYVYICTPESVYVYEVYSAFRGDPYGISYDTGIRTEEKRQAFIDYSLSCAEYETGIIPTIDDLFLTLSTCTGNGHAQRMIVHTMLVVSAPFPANE